MIGNAYRVWGWRWSVGGAWLWVCAGCYEGIGELERGEVADAGDSGESAGGPSGGGDGASETVEGGSPGIRLLTQREYHNSVQDLLGVALPLDEIPREANVRGHGHIADGQGVGLDALERYYELGLRAAEQWTAEQDCGQGDDDSCMREQALAVLRRAFRLPDGAEEMAAVVELLDSPDAGATTIERAQTAIAVALSGTRFLYRRELGSEPVGGSGGQSAPPNTYWLDGDEIAARMSYLLWQSLPDDELLAVAGELRDPQVRRAQLARMLDDSRAQRGLLGFAYDWLGAEGGATVADKERSVLEGTTSALSGSVADSLARTTQAALQDGAFVNILTTDTWWVDAEVADLLGTSVASDSEPVTLDESRAGLLMHPAVIAAHSKESGASPFHVGTFVAANLLCTPLGAPDELPPFDAQSDPNTTLREQLEALTQPQDCQFCHQIIGPPGFAFLAFDPIGRFMPEDGQGRPFDTSGEVPVGQGSVSFEGAAELSRQLAEQPEVARCLARRLFRWTYGYFEHAGVGEEVDVLAQRAVDTQTDVRALLEALIGRDAFAQVVRGE